MEPSSWLSGVFTLVLQSRWPEFNPRDPCKGRRRDSTPQTCPLTPKCTQCHLCTPHTSCAHTHTIKIKKWIFARLANKPVCRRPETHTEKSLHHTHRRWCVLCDWLLTKDHKTPGPGLRSRCLAQSRAHSYFLERAPFLNKPSLFLFLVLCPWCNPLSWDTRTWRHQRAPLRLRYIPVTLSPTCLPQ